MCPFIPANATDYACPVAEHATRRAVASFGLILSFVRYWAPLDWLRGRGLRRAGGSWSGRASPVHSVLDFWKHKRQNRIARTRICAPRHSGKSGTDWPVKVWSSETTAGAKPTCPFCSNPSSRGSLPATREPTFAFCSRHGGFSRQKLQVTPLFVRSRIPFHSRSD
jgi:hypothetical protein